jgi:hypothetical protein
MKKYLTILPIAFLLIGCSSLPLFDQFLEPQPEATETGLLLSDDFSEAGSGWDRVESEVGSTNYDHDAYHIIVNKPMVDLFANPGVSYEDVIIEVKAARHSGPTDNSYGVICRFQNDQNFYAALITSDGYAGIFEVTDGQYHLMGHDEMIPVPAIQGGTSTNLIHFECIGNSLALAVNGTPVDAQQDKSYADGDVGLIAGTFEDPGVHIVFDDFTVREP